MTTAIVPFIAFDSQDVARAHDSWGCNCGPGALAAALGLTLDEVRPHLGDFEHRRFMNPTQMGHALDRLKARWRAIPRETGPTWTENGVVRTWTENGVVRIQFGGPWLQPGVPAGAAYARSHWVAARIHEGHYWVFELSAGWLPAERWAVEVFPKLAAAVARADHTWFPTHRWEVRPR
jgi:hypothetical protein